MTPNHRFLADAPDAARLGGRSVRWRAPKPERYPSQNPFHATRSNLWTKPIPAVVHAAQFDTLSMANLPLVRFATARFASAGWQARLL